MKGVHRPAVAGMKPLTILPTDICIYALKWNAVTNSMPGVRECHPNEVTTTIDP